MKFPNFITSLSHTHTHRCCVRLFPFVFTNAKHALLFSQSLKILCKYEYISKLKMLVCLKSYFDVAFYMHRCHFLLCKHAYAVPLRPPFSPVSAVLQPATFDCMLPERISLDCGKVATEPASHRHAELMKWEEQDVIDGEVNVDGHTGKVSVCVYVHVCYKSKRRVIGTS